MPVESASVLSSPRAGIAELGVTAEPHLSVTHSGGSARRGKAPPVDTYSGETNFEDWLPALQRSSKWNVWSDEETLLQLAGHLRGRALEEWNLLEDCEKSNLEGAVSALKKRLEPSKTLAAQDFRRTGQRDQETVSDYIRRLEKMFRLTYGRDKITSETRDALLFGQMHEGLQYELMESPAVSGATGYKQLCQAARSEERRLLDLEKRHRFKGLQLSKTNAHTMPDTTPRATGPGITGGTETLTNSGNSKRCYNCGKPGHLARDCRTARTESGGARRGWTNYHPGTTSSSTTNQVVTTNVPEEEPDAGVENTLYSCLYHDSPHDVRQVRIQDRGSRPRRVRVGIQGVPTTGVVDSSSDITIMGKDLLKRVAAVARLGRSKLKSADRIPITYDGLPFTLHGRMDLDINFEGNTMRTPIYIKLDTAEQLLLSEGVCRQLGILHYHSSVTTDSQDLHASPRNLSNVAVGSPTPDSQENSPLTVQLGIVGNAGTSHETFVAAGQQTAGGAERNGGGDSLAATTIRETGSDSPALLLERLEATAQLPLLPLLSERLEVTAPLPLLSGRLQATA